MHKKVGVATFCVYALHCMEAEKAALDPRAFFQSSIKASQTRSQEELRNNLPSELYEAFSCYAAKHLEKELFSETTSGSIEDPYAQEYHANMKKKMVQLYEEASHSGSIPPEHLYLADTTIYQHYCANTDKDLTTDPIKKHSLLEYAAKGLIQKIRIKGFLDFIQELAKQSYENSEIVKNYFTQQFEWQFPTISKQIELDNGACTYNVDGNLIAQTTNNKKIKLIDTNTYEIIEFPMPQPTAGNNSYWTPTPYLNHDSTLLLLSYQKEFIVLDIKNRNNPKILSVFLKRLYTSFGFTPHNEILLLGHGPSRGVHTTTIKNPAENKCLINHEYIENCHIRCSATNRYLVSRGTDSWLFLLENSKKFKLAIPPSTLGQQSWAFSQNDSFFAFMKGNQKLYLNDLKNITTHDEDDQLPCKTISPKKHRGVDLITMSWDNKKIFGTTIGITPAHSLVIDIQNETIAPCGLINNDNSPIHTLFCKKDGSLVTINRKKIPGKPLECEQEIVIYQPAQFKEIIQNLLGITTIISPPSIVSAFAQ